MAHRLLRDPETDGWERSDFPIVCETCLGPNPYVRMQRIEHGGLCHISQRPYTVFRWRPGNEARYKKTIVCQEVAKAKNVCQVCLLDLDYGLPVQVRDTALGIANDDLPESEVGKEYQLNQKLNQGGGESSFSQARPNDLIMQLQRTSPYYKRNRAPVCTFFARGECNRGAECPYRHEMPTTGELAEQNIKDRYYGVNDPVANKMLRRAGELPSLVPPNDLTITTLYVGGLTPEITEDDIRDQFYSFGELKSVKKIDNKFCAFVTYTTREAAEKAAEDLNNKLIVKNVRCKLLWGRPQQARPEPLGEPGQPEAIAQPPMLPPQVRPQAPEPSQNFFNLPDQQAARSMYPSMDPSAMGSVGLKRQHLEATDAARAAKRPQPDEAGLPPGMHPHQPHAPRPPVPGPPPPPRPPMFIPMGQPMPPSMAHHLHTHGPPPG